MSSDPKHTPPDLLTVQDIVRRWSKWNISEDHVWRLHRKKILRATAISKRPLLFSLNAVRQVEESMR